MDLSATVVLVPRVSIKGSVFSNNVARRGDGGVINSISTVVITFVDCLFESNEADGKGGVLYANNWVSPYHTSINVNNCTFYNNSTSDGGVFHAQLVHISILQCEFKANNASIGAVMILSEESSVKIVDVIINKNTANMGALYFIACTVNLLNMHYIGNLGSFLAYSSMIKFMGCSKFSNNYSLLKPISALQEGGAITAFQSELTFYGNCILSNNSAEFGGAVHATESKLHFCGKIVIGGNSATKSGGGVYLQQSEFFCNSANITFTNNTAINGGGGGAYAVSSSIRLDYITSEIEDDIIYYVGSQLVFLKNKAKEGGALYLEFNAKLYVQMNEINHYRVRMFISEKGLITKALIFASNVANYGGAIYVADSTNSATCDSAPNKQMAYFTSSSTECFFQILLLNKLSQ